MNHLLEIVFNESTIIPIKVVTETSPFQFWVSIVVGSFFIFFILFQMLKLDYISTYLYLFRIKIQTKRNVLLIRHSSPGLFPAMITGGDANKVAKALVKFKGKAFDLIIHSPGGSVFASMLISRLFKAYPGKIRTIIPLYAMSGGTLLSLSTDELYMGDGASLGPVDPQLGNLFKYGSAYSWDKIVDMKGKKAEDSSIAFSILGKQVTATIRNYLDEIISIPLPKRDRTRFIKDITSGRIEHIYPFDKIKLGSYGFPIGIIPKKMRKILTDLLGTSTERSVFYV